MRLGTIVPDYYDPGEVVYIDDPAMLRPGCHYERVRPDPDQLAPAVLSYRVVCDGGLVIRGTKIPTWLIGATLIGAGLLLFRKGD